MQNNNRYCAKCRKDYFVLNEVWNSGKGHSGKNVYQMFKCKKCHTRRMITVDKQGNKQKAKEYIKDHYT